MTLDMHGSNLDPTWTILLCPKSTKPKSTLPSVSALEKTSTKTHLKALITAPPGTTGSYAVYVADTTGKVYDTSAIIVINPSADSKYIACSSPQGTAPTNTNLQCSFSPLSYQVAYDSFGKGVADRFVVVYVDIINKNHDLEFLLQDVRAGFPDYVVSSYDKKVPQDVSIKREQFSARAIIFRLTSATASVVSGVAGFAGSIVLQQAANIFSGPAQAGLQTSIPDLSSAELKNLDELGFSVASTVIPKAGAIRVAAFIPSDILDPASSDLKKRHPLKHPNSFSTYKGSELRALFSTMSVQVAGSHVQEVSPTATPTLDLFVTALPTLADLSKQFSVTIQGSGLDSVRTVELISSDGKTVLPASLSALPGAKTAAVDPHVAVLTIPAAADSPSGSYAITFILADGTTVDTGQSIVIPTPPVVATATADAATFQAIPANGKLTVTLTGTALTNLKAVSLQNGTTAPVPGVITANGTDVSVTVTFPQSALSAGTYKILIGTSAAAAPETDSTKQITL